MNFQPRLIRLRDAPDYLGMDKNRFNAEVRPYLVEIPIGSQGIGFDRFDLDEWFEQYKVRNGRPGKAMEGGTLWGSKSRLDSLSGGKYGMSKRRSAAEEYEKARELAILRKPNDT